MSTSITPKDELVASIFAIPPKSLKAKQLLK